MGIFNGGRTNLNIDICGIEIRDVCEKVGSVFGGKGKEVGKKIDNITKNVWIKYPKNR